MAIVSVLKVWIFVLFLMFLLTWKNNIICPRLFDPSYLVVSYCTKLGRLLGHTVTPCKLKIHNLACSAVVAAAMLSYCTKFGKNSWTYSNLLEAKIHNLACRPVEAAAAALFFLMVARSGWLGGRTVYFTATHRGIYFSLSNISTSYSFIAIQVAYTNQVLCVQEVMPHLYR